MKKKYLLLFFFIPMICLFLWACFLEYDKNSGHKILVSIKGYDPRDLLSGHYIQYVINWDKTDLNQFNNKSFTQQEFIKSLNKKALRFYVSEKYLKDLNSILSQNTTFNFILNGFQEKYEIEVIYSYKKGKHPIASYLLINGENYQNFFNKQDKIQ
jgi:uncharacterized membrane-anchored protein